MLDDTTGAIDDALESSNEVVTEENTESKEAVETPAETPDTDGEGKKKRFTGYQRKLYRQEQQIAELNAKLAELTTPKPTEKPVIDSFSTYDEYTEALTEWKISERDAKKREEEARNQEQRKQQEAVQAWQERIDSLPDEFDDYEEVVGRAFNNVALNPLVIDAAKEAGPELVYRIAKDLALRDKIVNMTPTQAIKEIAKLELELQKKPEVKVSKSSEPITPVKGAAPSTVKLDNLDTSEYLRRRHPKLLKR